MMNGKDLEGTGHGLTARLRKNIKTKSLSGKPMTCPRFKQKFLLNISTEYYCSTAWYWLSGVNQAIEIKMITLYQMMDIYLANICGLIKAI